MTYREKAMKQLLVLENGWSRSATQESQTAFLQHPRKTCEFRKQGVCECVSGDYKSCMTSHLVIPSAVFVTCRSHVRSQYMHNKSRLHFTVHTWSSSAIQAVIQLCHDAATCMNSNKHLQTELDSLLDLTEDTVGLLHLPIIKQKQ